jgi:hypothetical protein
MEGKGGQLFRHNYSHPQHYPHVVISYKRVLDARYALCCAFPVAIRERCNVDATCTENGKLMGDELRDEFCRQMASKKQGNNLTGSLREEFQSGGMWLALVKLWCVILNIILCCTVGSL